MARKKKSTTALTLVIVWICAIAISLPLAIYTINLPVLVPVRRDGEVVLEEVYTCIWKLLIDRDACKYLKNISVDIRAIYKLAISFFFLLGHLSRFHTDEGSSQSLYHGNIYINKRYPCSLHKLFPRPNRIQTMESWQTHLFRSSNPPQTPKTK